MSSYVTLSAISNPSSLSEKISRLVGNAARGAIVSIVDGIFAIGSTMDLPANRRAHQVRQVLSSRGLTLYRVSELSAEFFGRSSLFYVPHSLSFDAQDPASIPTFQQMLAISHITDYRLSDWFQVFGFDLDLIPRLRLVVPRKRSTLLDSRVYDSQAWIPWFADRTRSDAPPPIAPLGQLLARAAPMRAADLLALCKKEISLCQGRRRRRLRVPTSRARKHRPSRSQTYGRSVPRHRSPWRKAPFLCGTRLRMLVFATRHAREGPARAAFTGTSLYSDRTHARQAGTHSGTDRR